ncbi:MAG: hypothetical protein JSS30_06330 [Verrucomicrobia bacterium]|nr:hypothetical protein [Verrucomicrobiota bacterium]
MTIESTQRLELIPGGDKNVYFTLFSFLTPRELSTCALVSRKCRERIEQFNAPDRLQRACGFVGEVMTVPRNTLISNLLNIYDSILMQRPLADEEKEEVRPWATNPEDAPAELRFLWRAQNAPLAAQLLAACQGTDELDKRSVLFDKTSQFLNPETRACYHKLSEIACSIIKIIGPRENEGYVSPVIRAQVAAKESKIGEKCPQPDIEEAVWFFVSNFSRHKIAEAEENCKTLVQIELAKLDPREVEKMGQTLKETFTLFKQLVEIYQKTESIQNKPLREHHFAREANWENLYYRNFPNQDAPKPRAFVRFVGGIIIGVILSGNIVPILADAIPDEYSKIGVVSCLVIGFATYLIGLTVAFSDLNFFYPRAEIQHDDNGAEVVHIAPHPLGGRARLFCDVISAAAIGYVALQLFIFALRKGLAQ